MTDHASVANPAVHTSRRNAPPCGLSDAACRWWLAAIVITVTVVNLLYLGLNCPIDLSGDEAQYWEWSRRLDLSYYSKGPLVAYVIRASTSLLGDTAFAVRLPAVVIYAGVTIGLYAVARRAFQSDRVALATVVMAQATPIFLFYSLAMTIDTPLILSWTWATYFALRAVQDGARWPWIAAGALTGVGFLAKYAALLWWVGVPLFAALSASGRARVRWRWAIAGFALALACTWPVWVWNAQHDWVSFRHVAKQTGASGGSIYRGNFFEFVASQVGVANPAVFALIVAAAGWTWTRRRGDGEANDAVPATLLLAVGGAFFALTAVVSLFAKVQTNWPGPAYVTLIPLAAAYLLRSADWRRWRGVVAAGVAIGLGAHVIGREPAIVLRPLKALGLPDSRIAWIDGISRLRGWRALGERVGQEAGQLGPDTFILCDSYMQTALMAFYVPGRPTTFYAGSYFTRPSRLTQYDLWTDRRLDQPHLLGRNAVYVGKGGPMPEPLPGAFERVEKLPEIPVYAGGVVVETFKVWRCWGFKGLHRPDAPRSY